MLKQTYSISSASLRISALRFIFSNRLFFTSMSKSLSSALFH